MKTEEADVVNSHPIKDGLVAFCHQFKSSRARLDVIESSTAIEEVLSAEFGSDLLLTLILTLQTLPVARILHSQINLNTPLILDLLNLASQVVLSGFDTKLAIPLIELVIKNAPDIEIWNAVFELVSQTRPKATTPPIALENAFLDTPFRPSSASQSGIKQTRHEVDQRILEELTRRVYDDVKGFFERYFEGKTWTNKAGEIYNESISQYIDGRWKGWPEPPLEKTFYKWFINFQTDVLGGLSRKYYTSANQTLKGSEADRKLDIFLASADASFQASAYDYDDRVTDTLVQLTGYAREVFGSQPERRFVPGFTICGSLMRLWLFDRSGPYSSERFDIHKEPERFVRVIAGYALMTDAELGLNTFIKRDGNSRYIVARDIRIYLEDQPITSQKAVVCRGTACYRGRSSDVTDWQYVVKFAWPSDKRQREGRLLKLATERGVTGIAQWFHHEPVFVDGVADTIANLRSGMKFGQPRKISAKASWVNSGTESSQADSKTRSNPRGRSKSSVRRLASLAMNTSSSVSSRQKRKQDEHLAVEISPTKRSRSNDSQSVPRQVEQDAKEGDSQQPDSPSIQEPDVDSLTGEDSEAYDNRVHCCLVVKPAGRPLHTYRSVKELLATFRDAIKGHRSLLVDGRILHRDVSENNIIITEPATECDPRGRLIDLDLAKELDAVPSRASHRTGTMRFMAIEVLEGKGHTYRHDLESFFYVFIWMCIRYGYEGIGESRLSKRVRPMKTSRLHGWYFGTYAEIARNKLGDMVGFDHVTAEFAPQFIPLKGLAEELRDVLFGRRDMAPFTGTYKDHSIMYSGMINAFNKVISGLRKEY
ncbi:hypothetical protein F4813DRAFT_392009 [Daldinia decipiens]|uniref:uncharacterized protein n=1 Tax=Daldinia decipiens TaxID=326647 RepID=UPI0020C37A21|nr:uncharacterized protein F4813DRAFT_392009 [Daldinia decipiens]KAI1655018.1 hypothetical protein F4813DRAFT_392009 [Daldinia decipiens]